VGKLISHEELLLLLRYDPQTGRFKWITPGNGYKKDWFLGTLEPHGYRTIRVLDRKYYAHRLAWFYNHGKWPVAEIDHINGERSDNRLCNLREAFRSQQLQNASLRKDNTSGVKGVVWHSDIRKWVARIHVDGKAVHIGCYKEKEHASAAYDMEARRLFGEFARCNCNESL